MRPTLRKGRARAAKRCGGASLLVLLLSALHAGAAPRVRTLTDAVRVRPGVTCLEEVTLRDQVRTWLGSDEVEGDLIVEVEGSPDDARAVSFRVWRDGGLIAHRRFAPGPQQCAQMHAAVGLAVALAFKVSLLDDLLGEPAPRAFEDWSAGGQLGVAWSVVPGVAGAATLWVERALPQNFALRAGVVGLMGQGVTFAHTPGRFSTSLVAVEVAVCSAPVFSAAVRGRVCTGLDAGSLMASGSDFSASRDAVLGWFAVSNSAGVSVKLASHWSLETALALVVPLQKTRIGVTNAEGAVVDTREFASAGGMASLGASYEF